MNKNGNTILAFTLMLIMIFSCNSFVFAEDAASTVKYSFSDGTLTVSGTGVVDNSYNKDINVESIKTVKIEAGATAIVAGAFENCTNLIKVDIPYSVKVIGKDAFKGVAEGFVANVHEDSAAISYCKDNDIKTNVISHTLSAGDFLWSANCKKAAVNFTCSACGKEDIYRVCTVTSAVSIKPTCKDMGTTEYTATYKTLSEKKSVQDIALVDHTWDTEKTVDKEANCTEDGVKSIHCKICGIVKEGTEEAIPSDGKSHVLETVTKKAVNHQMGYTYDKCTVCGYKTPTEYIPYNSKNFVKNFKVTAGSAAFTAKWKKQTSTKFDGYIITYSRYKSMKNSKSVKVSRSASSKKISKLTKGKKYYVEICSYEIYKNNYYFSEVTKTTVTTK